MCGTQYQMSRTIFTLTAKGTVERSAEQPTLPAELGELLRLVDGERTREDLHAVADRNAITAGGLRWLIAAGYLAPAIQPMSAEHGDASANPSLAQPGAGSVTPLDVEIRTPQQICRSLSSFMLETIERRLDEQEFIYCQQIESATSLDELVPLLNPLIEAIEASSGGAAAAQFADSAAFILNPHERRRKAG